MRPWLDSVSESRTQDFSTAGAGQTKDKRVATMPVDIQRFSLVDRAKTFSELAANVDAVDPTVPESMPMLDVALSIEPDPIEGFPATDVADDLASVQNRQIRDSVISALKFSMESLPHPMEALQRALRIAHVMPYDAKHTYQDIFDLIFAVSVGDAMMPGFTDLWLQDLKDQLSDEADAGPQSADKKDADKMEESDSATQASTTDDDD
jgi:hypothetical protein